MPGRNEFSNVLLPLGSHYPGRDDGVKDRLTTSPRQLRYGVSDTWELRLETDGLSRLRRDDTNIAIVTRQLGTADVAIGAKWHASNFQ
jgi:hypothetical protein